MTQIEDNIKINRSLKIAFEVAGVHILHTPFDRQTWLRHVQTLTRLAGELSNTGLAFSHALSYDLLISMNTNDNGELSKPAKNLIDDLLRSVFLYDENSSAPILFDAARQSGILNEDVEVEMMNAMVFFTLSLRIFAKNQLNAEKLLSNIGNCSFTSLSFTEWRNSCATAKNNANTQKAG